MRHVAYLDESVDRESPPAEAVAGFVASEATWAAVDRDWLRLLEKYELPHLHSMELFRAKQTCKGWTDERIVSFAGEAVSIVRSFDLSGYIVVVDPTKYMSRKAKTGKSSNQSALGFCFMVLNDAILRRLLGENIDFSVLYRWERRGTPDAEISQSLSRIVTDHDLSAVVQGIEFVGKDSSAGAQLSGLLACLGGRRCQLARRDHVNDRFGFILDEISKKVCFDEYTENMG